ncbi:hypothetical protein C4K22_4766 [Pseudomonas chlororaphis subsp. aurantiaca]|nr:hypothetical protein C4K22_4766 [Pseudomonas chlororaphis subsp. aurantiaca]AZD43830.1 hypothetical protein C4K21_4774 [Pseudomonas chlororaphis subsp. aurantiaca]
MVRQHRRFQTRKKDEARGNSSHAQGRHPCCTRTTIMAKGHQCILHQPAMAPVCSPGARSMAPPFDLQQHP